MNLCQFNNVLYKGNINIDFYFFCLKRDKLLIKYIFLGLWYYILSFIKKSKKDICIKRQFRYLKEVKNLDKVLLDFYKNKKINNYFKFDCDLIVDRVPEIFIKYKFKGIKIVAYELDENYDIKLEKFNKDISKISNIEKIYLSNRYALSCVNSNISFVVRNNRIKCLKIRKKMDEKIFQFISLIIFSFILTCFSFCFTNSYLDIDMFYSYFEIKLFILNWLPVLFFMMLLFVFFKRVHISWLITSFLIFALGVANQTKVFYRDDVVKFEDFTLIKEAIIMSGECNLVIKSYTILLFLFIIFAYFFSRKYLKKLEFNKIKRYSIIFGLIMLCLFGYKKIYKNYDIYNSVGDTSLINVWIFTRQSQIRGLIYPFIYTLEDGKFVKPNNYDKNNIEKILDEYDYQDIPKDKKVNVIAIMLEAYADFSNFDKIEFNEDIYKDLHDIQKRSISGNLITNIFGGGTIVTERNFLTGYDEFSNFRKRTNSYVWYFKEQGYRTEAMHPIYGAFYNRASINPNLGFDMYYNYENMFSKMESETVFVNDELFFDTIIEGYEKSIKDGVPYFNFSVTYQNHVPYDSYYVDVEEYYFDNTGLDDESYKMINQYFTGIKNTNKALNNLVKYFDKEKEPVVILFFGDHKPALGDNASIYHELGINIKLDNLDGFINYFQTPYVIHANDTAKDILDNDFVGKGDIISPIFLMNELFDNMGLKGNNYLQYMNDLRKKVDVINQYYYKEEGDFVLVDESNNDDLIEEYRCVNYYQLNN